MALFLRVEETEGKKFRHVMEENEMGMNRREFIKIGLTGMTAVAFGNAIKIPGIFSDSRALAAEVALNLSITDALIETVDLNQTYIWAFDDGTGPKFPGPTIFARQGDTIRLRITNNLDEDHAVAVTDTRISSGVISPGQTADLRFDAPPAGTYIYYDPLNAPVNRVMGLNGTLIVLPGGGEITPYTGPPAPVDQLFRDLGNSSEFPGNRWDPARTWIWHLHNIDPRFNAMAQAGQTINRIQFRREFIPRYFFVSGKQGFFSAHDPNISPHGRVGQPALLRAVNTGMSTHSLHPHMNHVFILSVNNEVQDNLWLVDAFTLTPLGRVDALMPFIRPPDIPPVAVLKGGSNPQRLVRLDAPEELALVLADGVPLSPFAYPMHCHTEMSQTMAGGNYPIGGAVVHLELTGDIDGVNFPNV